ncbi:efflux RND transporter permease subunit [Hahella ganghwensis]|uniref:efflux RND transporter permease subunit n=1 Tax=Hahella ganghwensis TaxID=286420 RepID=UPI0003770F85|nr:MMPL family transporter [Hahella ganghwensis]
MKSDRIANFLVSGKDWLAVVSIAIIVFSICGLPNLYVESDYSVFFDPTNPQLVQHHLIEDEFTKSDTVSFVISSSSDHLFNRQNLEGIIYLTDEAWKLPYSGRVDSITNHQHTDAVGDELFVGDLVDDDVLEQGDFDEVRQIAIGEPELSNFIVSDDGSVSAANVTLILPDDPIEKDRASIEVVSAARKLASAVMEKYPGLNIQLAGQTTVVATFNTLSEQDSKILFPIMIVLMAVLLILLLRSFTGMLATLVIILTSVACTLGIMGWINTPLNQVTAALPVIIMTIAICDSVHLIYSFQFHRAIGQDKLTALINTYKSNLQPVFLTSATTAVGFLAMNFSEAPPFRELGNWGAVGIMLAFLWSLTLLPALLYWLPINVPKQSSVNFADRFSAFLIRNQKRVLILGPLLILVVVSQIPRNELNDNTLGYFKTSVPFRQAADFMQENLTGFDSFNYALRCQETNCINEPEFLKKVDRFKDWLLLQPEIVHVVSYTNVIKRLNQNMNAGDETYYRIPENRELSAQYQLLYELSLPFGLDLNNIINFDKSALKITALVKGQKAKQLLEIESRIDQWLATHLPELRTAGGGISIMFSHLGQNNIHSMVSGSLLGLFFITITLILALRSIKYGLISIIPNALPAAMAFGIWGITVAEVNVAVAIVFSFTLGIIVDDTVHFLSKYIRARKDLGLNAEEAVTYAFHHVGKAIVVTTLVLSVGFLTLAFSEFNVNSYMGSMVAMTIVFALILDFFLLPVILLNLDRRQRSGSNPNHA